jgi:ABC-2 type transport system permease protein
MHKILQIAQREYLETVKTKAFIIGVLMAPLIVGGVIFFTSRITKRDTGPRPALQVELVTTSKELSAEAKSLFDSHNQAHQNRQLALVELQPEPSLIAAEDKAKGRLRQGRTSALVVLDETVVEGSGKVRIYTSNPKASDLDMFGTIESLLHRAVVNQRCKIQSIAPELLAKIRDVAIETIEVGKADGEQRVQGQADKVVKMMVPFFFMYLMFMGMVGTGQQMLSSVIEEKNSRVIEVLLSAVSPLELMTGKIVGLAAIGLTVVCIWAAAALGTALYKGVEIAVSGQLAFYFVVYYILGFLLFTALLAAIGSVCNTIKETQGLMMPVMLIFVLPMMAWFKLVQDPDGTFARVLAFVPPITPLVMVLRLSASASISTIEIIASIVVLSIGVFVTMWAAAKVFRTGILMYGKRPGVREICRWLRQH